VPLYEYQCPNDGRFEVIRKFSDPPLTACPTCGAEIQKLASAPAIQFKGTGWYVTDYAKKSGGGGDGATSSSESGAKEGSKDSGSKDSGSKDSAAKDSGSKDSGARDSGAKDSSSKDSSSTQSKTTAATGSGSSK
jgi:putative FmdB family regulatory protein